MDSVSLSTNTTASQGIPRTRATTEANLVALAFKNADKRIERQRASVSVELSAFGRQKSSFSDVRIAARELTDAKPTVSNAAISKAVETFVTAFNAAVQPARPTPTSKATQAVDNRALVAENNLRRAISAESPARSDLKTIGITQQQDGALAIDLKKLDAALKTNPDAVRSTLAAIAKQVDNAATRELGDNGNIGQPLNSPGNRVRTLERQQAEQQAVAVAARQTTVAQTANVSANQNNQINGAAAYQRIFSL